MVGVLLCTLVTASGVISLWSLCGDGGWVGDTRPVFPCLTEAVLDCLGV